MKQLFKIFFILIIGVMVLHAQDNKVITEKVQKAVVRLQQKLILSDDQTAKIKVIVIDNYSQVKENKTAVLETKIISLLNEKQKEKFTIIKKEWLGSFTKN